MRPPRYTITKHFVATVFASRQQPAPYADDMKLHEGISLQCTHHVPEDMFSYLLDWQETRNQMHDNANLSSSASRRYSLCIAKNVSEERCPRKRQVPFVIKEWYQLSTSYRSPKQKSELNALYTCMTLIMGDGELRQKTI